MSFGEWHHVAGMHVAEASGYVWKRRGCMGMHLVISRSHKSQCILFKYHSSFSRTLIYGQAFGLVLIVPVRILECLGFKDSL